MVTSLSQTVGGGHPDLSTEGAGTGYSDESERAEILITVDPVTDDDLISRCHGTTGMEDVRLAEGCGAALRYVGSLGKLRLAVMPVGEVAGEALEFSARPP